MHPKGLLHRLNYLTVSSRNLVRLFVFQENLLTYTLYDGLPGAGIYAISGPLLSSSSSSKYLRKKDQNLTYKQNDNFPFYLTHLPFFLFVYPARTAKYYHSQMIKPPWKCIRASLIPADWF